MFADVINNAQDAGGGIVPFPPAWLNPSTTIIHPSIHPSIVHPPAITSLRARDKATHPIRLEALIIAGVEQAHVSVQGSDLWHRMLDRPTWFVYYIIELNSHRTQRHSVARDPLPPDIQAYKENKPNKKNQIPFQPNYTLSISRIPVHEAFPMRTIRYTHSPSKN